MSCLERRVPGWRNFKRARISSTEIGVPVTAPTSQCVRRQSGPVVGPRIAVAQVRSGGTFFNHFNARIRHAARVEQRLKRIADAYC